MTRGSYGDASENNEQSSEQKKGYDGADDVAGSVAAPFAVFLSRPVPFHQVSRYVTSNSKHLI